MSTTSFKHAGSYDQVAPVEQMRAIGSFKRWWTGRTKEDQDAANKVYEVEEKKRGSS